tara:strand:- start:290 stop:520 length:231 start_codon:yes stop_codon:yes gene_type:complete
VLTIEECNFVFERIWTVTVKHNDHHKHDVKDFHIHGKSASSVMPKELHHVIDLAGKLLNKEAPSDDDTIPFTVFMK